MTDGWPTKICKGGTCGRRIVMVKTEANRWQPVDLEPRADGNLILFWGVDPQTGRSVPRSRVVGLFDGDADGEPRYYPHHGTCPDVDEFRG